MAQKVAKATQVPFAVAFDRSGHRFAGPAISMGAKYFDAKGNLALDDGYKAMAKRLYDWSRDGTMPKEVWGGVGGATYRDAFEEFANGRVVMYLSGSWQIRRMDTQIGKNFDWIAVPNPCGPAACTGIPGGAAFVALKRTKNPKDVGRFLDYLASEPIYAEYMARTENIPAHAGVAKKGVEYKISPQAKAALNVFVAEVPKLSPVAYQIQGYKLNRADNFARRAIGRVYHRFVSFAFGLHVRDTDCDFRLMRRSMLERVRLEKTTGVICVELVRTLQDAGAKFVEVGVHHYPRVHGRSEFFKLSSVARTLWDLAKLWVQLVLLRRGKARSAPAR